MYSSFFLKGTVLVQEAGPFAATFLETYDLCMVYYLIIPMAEEK